MSSTVPERPPNTEPLPSAEELAEARAALEAHNPPGGMDTMPYFLVGWLSAAIRSHARSGYDPGVNRRALAMVAAYEQLRLEQADALAAELAAARSLDAPPEPPDCCPDADDPGEVGGETVEDAEDQS